MGEYTGVGLGVRTPDMMGKLSQLLSVRAQQQALAGQAAEVAGAEQTQRQRAALAKFDFDQLTGDDGNISEDKIPLIRDAAGDMYPELAQKLLETRGKQLDLQSTLYKVDSQKRDALSNMVGPLISMKDEELQGEKGLQAINDTLAQYGELYGKAALPIVAAYGPALQQAPPERRRQALRMIQMQAQSASEQLSAQQPSFLNTGPTAKQINPAVAGDAASDVGMGVAPAAVILTDGKGAKYSFDPSTKTVTLIGGGGKPASAKPTDAVSPPKSGFTQPGFAGFDKDIAAHQEEVGRIRAAADTAPQNRDIFKHILKLADDTNTGPLVSFFQNTAIGGQVFGDNYQELAKYLEKQALGQMQAMGGAPSDARLSSAVAANGSTKFNAKALKAVTQFNHAANTGLEKYRNGIDQAIGTDNPDYTALPRFKADWAKNFSIDVFRLENAIEDGDEHAKNQILDSLSEKEAAALLKKMDNLDSLAATGNLPK